ncbi:MAG: glycosyltransferase, partial [Candidatus Rokubacteria bacterium]|nr:glycosyltransferase [Candidatus Rokubacteria bacterium]
RLKRLAWENIRFLGRVPEAALAAHYRACRAVVVPGEEDFGLTAVEAQAHGRPVVAFAGGGALETVADGVSGIFFRQQTADALIEALRAFDRMSFDPLAIRRGAEAFDRSVFAKGISRLVAAAIEGRPEGGVAESGDGGVPELLAPRAGTEFPPGQTILHPPQQVGTARG